MGQLEISELTTTCRNDLLDVWEADFDQLGFKIFDMRPKSSSRREQTLMP